MPRIARPAGPEGAPANLTVAYDSVPGIGTDRDAIRRDRGSMWRWDGFLHASAAEAVTLGEGNTPLAARAVARPGRRLDQGRIAQPDLVVQGPAGLGGAHHGEELRRQGHRLELLGQRRRVGGGLCRQGRHAVRGLHLHRRSAGPLVTQMRAYGAMVVEGRRQGRPLAAADARRARVRLVSDLAVLRAGGRQQSLRHGRLQDDRLRDRRGLRLAAARLVRAAGVLRRCAVRHVEGLRGAEGAGLDRPHAAPGRGRGLGLARGGDGRRRRRCRPNRPRNAPSIATSIGALQGTVQALDVLRKTQGRGGDDRATTICAAGC